MRQRRAIALSECQRLVARALRPKPIYEALLAQDGIELPAHAVADALESVMVRDVTTAGPVVTFSPATTFRAMVECDGEQEVFPVLGDDRELVGLVAHEEVRILRDASDLDGLVNAADLMRAPLSVTPRDNLHLALRIMSANRLTQLPVLDDGRVVALIDEVAIAKAYLHERTSHDE